MEHSLLPFLDTKKGGSNPFPDFLMSILGILLLVFAIAMVLNDQNTQKPTDEIEKYEIATVNNELCIKEAFMGGYNVTYIDNDGEYRETHFYADKTRRSGNNNNYVTFKKSHNFCYEVYLDDETYENINLKKYTKKSLFKW